MQTLLDILDDIRPDVDFTAEQRLIDGGVLDSFDIISLVGELNDAFHIRIGAGDLVAENFNSAGAMWALVQRLQNKG